MGVGALSSAENLMQVLVGVISFFIAVFYTIEVSLDSEKNAKLHSWDTAGLEEYRSFPPMFYLGSDAAIVVYDVTWRASFEDAKKWVDDFIEVSEPGAFVALVGNKVDLEGKRVVSYEVMMR